jgi:peroxiredoxin
VKALYLIAFCCVSCLGQNIAHETPFQTIPAAPPQVSDKLVFSAITPDFDIRDLAGKVWRSSDLTGKITIIQIWSIFCPPCRQEHASLQDFFNKIRSLHNVQVLTINVDGEPGQVREYMDRKGFTFPVVVDGGLHAPQFPVDDVWIIGPNGRKAEPVKTWSFGRILIEVEKIATSAVF